MRLEARGHPVHTRALSVTLAARSDAALDVDGAILDLRKRGLVPIAGDLQGSGIIHDMRLAGVIDPADATLVRLSAEQRSVAFEPSVVTGGESCRDPIGRIDALAGARLDRGWGRRLAAEIGGPRGCSHLATLAHLLGSAAWRGLERERALHGEAPVRPPGQRVFRRDLVIDGIEPAAGRLQLVAQLTDLHTAPAPLVAVPMQRFAEQLELRLLAEVDFTTLAVVDLVAAVRRRGPDDLERAAWSDASERARWLVGRRLGAGITAELLARFGDAPDDHPLLDTLLNLAPALVQCAAAMSDAWLVGARANPSLMGMGGLPDSCWMWRRDGALVRARETEAGTTPKVR